MAQLHHDLAGGRGASSLTLCGKYPKKAHPPCSCLHEFRSPCFTHFAPCSLLLAPRRTLHPNHEEASHSPSRLRVRRIVSQISRYRNFVPRRVQRASSTLAQSFARLSSFADLMFSKILATAGLLASFAVSVVNAVPTIEAVGAKFFYSNGTQYYIKGMAVPPSSRLQLTALQVLHIN
jgi:hypothetical protein